MSLSKEVDYTCLRFAVTYLPTPARTPTLSHELVSWRHVLQIQEAASDVRLNGAAIAANNTRRSWRRDRDALHCLNTSQWYTQLLMVSHAYLSAECSYTQSGDIA